MHLFREAMLLYLSSLEHKSFLELKNTQLFYLVIKLMKPFAVPRAYTGWKTKRGIGIILLRAENFTKWLTADVSGSPKILDNISSVILSTEKYDTDTSLSFAYRTSLWYGKKFSSLDN